MKLALNDVKVIEFGSLIGAPFCGKMLADLGAHVVKVEDAVQGDAARRRGPFLQGILGRERSGLFLYLNSNKLGVTLNVEESKGVAIFKQLIKDADVLIEDTEPDRMARLGLDYAQLKAVNPSLVMTSITPFGQTGPYKHYKGTDLTGWHMGGVGIVTPRHMDTADQEPLRVMRLADFVTGMTAATGTLSALRVQRQRGIGQQVEVSRFEALARMGAWNTIHWPYEHSSPSRVSTPRRYPCHYVQCQDGWFFVLCAEEHQWRGFVEVMGSPAWATEEIFSTVDSRAEHWEGLGPLIDDWAKDHTKAEIFEAAKTRGVPLAPVNSIAEVMRSEQLTQRSFFVEADHPEAGRITYPGIPYRSPGTRWSIRRPAPLLGQHNREVYCDQLGYSEEELDRMRTEGVV